MVGDVLDAARFMDIDRIASLALMRRRSGFLTSRGVLAGRSGLAIMGNVRVKAGDIVVEGLSARIGFPISSIVVSSLPHTMPQSTP